MTEVIAASGRLTKAATLANPLAQHIRNALAHVLLGLAPVQRALEGSMTEISIGYHESPLNGTAWSTDVRPGSRMPPLPGEQPYGAGADPRFTLRADVPPGNDFSARFPALVDPVVRQNRTAAGFALVRPDGYLALAAPGGAFDTVEAYLSQVAGSS